MTEEACLSQVSQTWIRHVEYLEQDLEQPLTNQKRSWKQIPLIRQPVP